MNRPRGFGLLLALVFAVAFAAGALLPRLLPGRAPAHGDGAVAARLPSFREAGVWITPARLDSLRGNVVLVVLWSDTDPAALAMLPEAEGWHLAYARYGLRVIGVHVPEFTFAADTAVAARVVRRLGVTFPIVSDASYRLSGRFHRTLERPSFYVADPAGRIVYETGGARPASVDRALRAALALARPGAGIPTDGDTAAPVAGGAAPQRVVYLGTSRAQEGPIAGSDPGMPQTFTALFQFQEEGREYVAYPVGRWTPEAEGLACTRAGPESYVSVRGAGEVWSVIAPPPDGPGRVWILDRATWLAREHAGADVRFDGRGASYVDVAEPRAYAIARCPDGCVLKLSPAATGTTILSFVFEPARAAARGTP